jgi:hypothetical protein
MSTAPIQPGEPKPSSQGYIAWMVEIILLIAVAAGVFAWFNLRQDVLGLHGRSPVEIYALERYSKYLMSYRYVPEHYDGILLSNSVAANWDTGQFTQYHVFNAGLRGSTIAEEKLIVDNAVNRGHMKIAIIVLLPSLTGSHDMRTAYMTPHDYTASFGSVQTLIIDTQEAMERFGPRLHLPASAAKHKFEPDGAMNFPMARSASTVVPPLDETEIQGDPVAVDELRQVLENLHAHGVKVYGVYAPLYAPRWQMQGPELRAWMACTTALFAPGDTIIDLNDGQLAAVEADRENFPDYLHLTSEAASKVTANVVARIEHP